MATPYFRDVNSAKCLSVVGDVYRLLATSEDTGGAMCLIDALLAPGGGPPMHTHEREDETFFVLEGEVTFVVNGSTTVAKAGTTVYAPRRSKHRFTNATKVPARMILVTTPGGIERMFEEIGVELAPGSTNPAPVDDATIAKVMSVCPRYGITILPPA